MTSSHSNRKGLSKHLSKIFALFDITSFYTDTSSSNEKTVNVMLNLMIYIPLIIAAIYSFAKVYEFTYPTPEKVKADRMEYLKKQFHKKLDEEEASFFTELKGILGSLSFIIEPFGYVINIFKNLFLWLRHNPFRTLMLLALALYIGLSFYFTSLYKAHFALKKWSSYINMIIITGGIMLLVAVFTLFSDKGYVSIENKPTGLGGKSTMRHEFGWMLSSSMGYYKSILLVLITMCIPLFILWLMKTFSFLSGAASILIGLGVGAILLYFANKEYSSTENKSITWIKEHSDLFKPGFKLGAKEEAKKKATNTLLRRIAATRARSSIDHKKWRKAKKEAAASIEKDTKILNELEVQQKCIVQTIMAKRTAIAEKMKAVAAASTPSEQKAASIELKKWEDWNPTLGDGKYETLQRRPNESKKAYILRLTREFVDTDYDKYQRIISKDHGPCANFRPLCTTVTECSDQISNIKKGSAKDQYGRDRLTPDEEKRVDELREIAKKITDSKTSLKDESFDIRGKIDNLKKKIQEINPNISFKEWVRDEAIREEKQAEEEKMKHSYTHFGFVGGGDSNVDQVGGYLVVNAKPLRSRLSGTSKKEKETDNLEWVILKRVAEANPGWVKSEKERKAKAITNYIRLHWKRKEMEDAKGEKYIRYESDEDESLFTRIFKAIANLPTLFMDTINNFHSIPTWAWVILLIEIVAIILYFIIPLVPEFLYTHAVSKKDELLRQQSELATDKEVIQKDKQLNELLGGMSIDWETILSEGLYKPNMEEVLRKYLLERGYQSVHDTKSKGIFSKIVSGITSKPRSLEAAITYVQTNGPVIITLRNQVKMLNTSRWESDKTKKDTDNIFKTKVLLKDPIYTDKKTTISQYKDIGNAVGTFNYNYCISGWFFLHEQPPSNRAANTKFTSILNYANKPNILFNVEKNTLRITMDDSLDKQRVIYETENFPLQKWNNVIVNYDGGTLDIFINSELVSSTSSIVPFMTYDAITTGSDAGVSGGVCNITYFPRPLTLSEIKLFYKSLKSKNPPIV